MLKSRGRELHDWFLSICTASARRLGTRYHEYMEAGFASVIQISIDHVGIKYLSSLSLVITAHP